MGLGSALSCDMSKGLGVTATQFFQLGSAAKPFVFGGGESLPGITLAYETYGTLNPDKSNAILLFHALSGSQHAAGITPEVPGTDERWTDDIKHGWWNLFVGPGKALDTNRYFVICVNYLGGCYGSSGPASINPATGKPYGKDFPSVLSSDVVRSQAALLDHLGIQTLHAVIGSSVGGLLANLAGLLEANVLSAYWISFKISAASALGGGLLGFVLAFAALAMLPVFGTDFGKGAIRWFSFGFASVQPSEFLKPGFMIVVAWLMAASLDLNGPPGKLISFALAVTVVMFLALQPDFGQALLVLFGWGVIYFVAGAPMWLIVSIIGSTGGAGFVAYGMSEHLARRIDGFLASDIDPRSQLGYATNAIQEGGFFGVGIGAGEVKPSRCVSSNRSSKCRISITKYYY